LRHFGVENQDDWDKLLVFAEFAYNNSKHSSTGFSPFRLNYGFDPTLPSSFSVFRDQHPDNDFTKGKCPRVNEFFKRIQQAIVDARKNIEVAQQQQKYYADLKRRLDEKFGVDVKFSFVKESTHQKRKHKEAPSKVYWTTEYN
jgi:hypothetical protein